MWVPQRGFRFRCGGSTSSSASLLRLSADTLKVHTAVNHSKVEANDSNKLRKLLLERRS